MTIDTAAMEDLQVKAEAEAEAEEDHLRLQLSSLQLNNNTPFSDGPDGQEVFYDDDGFLFNIGFGNVVVVDNLPVVDAKVLNKLETEIRQLFSEVGVIKEDGFSMPLNPLTHKTLGRCFIEFNSRQEAELARVMRDGYNFDIQALSVNLYDDFDRFIDIPDMGITAETNTSASMSSVYPIRPPSLLSPLKEEDEVPEEAQQGNKGRELGQQKEKDVGEVIASMGVMGFGGEMIE